MADALYLESIAMSRPRFDPRPATLEGAHAVLAPLDLRHATDLSTPAASGHVDVHASTGAAIGGGRRVDDPQALTDAEPGGEVAFAILEAASGRAVGSTRFPRRPARAPCARDRMDVDRRPWRRTAINTECKLLLLGMRSTGTTRTG
jgi:hypothetical protein